MQAISEPPRDAELVRFPDRFGPRYILTVDTEEEFDWGAPFTRDRHGLAHVPALARFQAFCEKSGVVPVYLVDWPIANDPAAIEILKPACAAGRAEVGIQLHPWVSPPFDEEVTTRNSFAGNLPQPLEREKLTRLRDAIAENFGLEPRIYRAGRYGTGSATADMLKDLGVRIDTSVRSNFDYSRGGGPDYRKHPLKPYWLERDAGLLELPLTTVFWGVLRRQGRQVAPMLGSVPRLGGAAARLGLLEKIALTPEGVSVDEAIRGIDMAIDDGLPILNLSFHSPSLAPGHTPYVRSEDDVEILYDWFERVFAYLEMRGVAPTHVDEILHAVAA
ncbi:polysaccharide deacetylase family protein [Qipengyuania sp. JC766]|uniref:polysaccharide deacetylase family protein n=1 Tax=Qipengyuania sp. JC766 TaxID=3232139 RepID=UPI003458385C